MKRRKQTPRAVNIFRCSVFKKQEKRKEKKENQNKSEKKGKHNFHKEKKRIHANQMLFRNDELNCRIFLGSTPTRLLIEFLS